MACKNFVVISNYLGQCFNSGNLQTETYSWKPQQYSNTQGNASPPKFSFFRIHRENLIPAALELEKQKTKMRQKPMKHYCQESAFEVIF